MCQWAQKFIVKCKLFRVQVQSKVQRYYLYYSILHHSTVESTIQILLQQCFGPIRGCDKLVVSDHCLVLELVFYGLLQLIPTLRVRLWTGLQATCVMIPINSKVACIDSISLFLCACMFWLESTVKYTCAVAIYYAFSVFVWLLARPITYQHHALIYTGCYTLLRSQDRFVTALNICRRCWKWDVLERASLALLLLCMTGLLSSMDRNEGMYAAVMPQCLWVMCVIMSPSDFATKTKSATIQ